MNENDTENLLRKIRELSIEEKQIVSDIIDQLATPANPSRPSEINQGAKGRAICAKGFVLQIGDRVRILNNRKTGKIGDTARITKFNKKFVALELESNKSYTQRDPKNISSIREAKRSNNTNTKKNRKK